jgi:uncharacterized protein
MQVRAKLGMAEDVSFCRVGVTPGRKPELRSAQWHTSDVPLSEGMAPLEHVYYSNEGDGISAGIWACDAGNIEIRCNPVEEVCFVIRGTVKVTDLLGHSETFGAGECLVLPRGFSGIWSQSDDFTKFFVSIKPSDGMSAGEVARPLEPKNSSG